jgi:hypothetical protein
VQCPPLITIKAIINGGLRRLDYFLNRRFVFDDKRRPDSNPPPGAKSASPSFGML